MREVMLPISTSRSLNLSFDSLSYSVKTGIIKRETRQLLTTVSGEFRVGELTAIMGPSGSGKTTLMDILAGYTVQTSGAVSVNGSPRDLADFRRSSAYIMQDDNLEPLLTVEESVHIAANLKLDWNNHDKAQRVNEIIFALGLEACRHTRAAKLSGGQRKRLAIALELVNNPPVMFFDEPASGLDIVTSKQCINLLRALARDGPCTIIMTIHQPSGIHLDMIDHLYVLVNGHCVFTGSTKAIVPFLEKHDLHCPTYHNPADFLVEVCNGEYGDWNDKLVETIDNGKSNDWRSASNKSTRLRFKTRLSPKESEDRSNQNNDEDDKIQSDKVTENHCGYYATSFLQQLYILIKRNAIKLSRDRVLTFTRLTMHCIIALIVGIIYYGIGEDAAFALDNFNLLFFSLMFLMFSAFSSTITTFPLSLPIVTREHFNRWYKLRSFYLANQLADFPIQILAVTIYTYIVYFMTGQILEVKRFILWSMVCVVVSLVAQLIGVIIGIALSLQNSVVFGALFIMPFVIFSGFFVHLNDAPFFLQWLFHSSFLKYGFECAMTSLYGFDRPKMNCSQDYCHFIFPAKLMKEMGMINANYWFSFIVLCILYFTLDLTAFIILRLRLKKII